MSFLQAHISCDLGHGISLEGKDDTEMCPQLVWSAAEQTGVEVPCWLHGGNYVRRTAPPREKFSHSVVASIKSL